jgi:hypothetical protein
MGTNSRELVRVYCLQDKEARATRMRQQRKENEKTLARTQNIPSKMDDFI